MSQVEMILQLLIHTTRNLPEADRPGAWRPWQSRIIQSFINYPLVALQGCRQATGKTFLAAIWAICFILLGYRVEVGLPSLRQGSRILLRKIHLWMLCLERELGMRRDVKNTLEIEWDNGGGLMALSTNEQAERGVQGYTCSLQIIDEAHEALDDYFGNYSPHAAIALKEGYGSRILLGVGGIPASVMEHKKELPHYHLEFWDDDAILKMDPSWEKYFQDQQLELTPEKYNQMFKLRKVTTGGRALFPNLLERAPVMTQFPPRYIFGIDVGKRKDATIVASWEIRPSSIVAQQMAANLVEAYEIPGSDYMEQAHSIIKYVDSNYLYSQRDIAIELNGPGEVLRDVLGELGWRMINGIWITGQYKEALLKLMQSGVRQKWIGCPDPVARADLSEMSMDVDLKGKVTYSHSDIGSAAIVGINQL